MSDDLAPLSVQIQELAFELKNQAYSEEAKEKLLSVLNTIDKELETMKKTGT